MRIGVIGQGGFGTFVVTVLPPNSEVVAHDCAPERNTTGTTLDEVVAVDLLLLAVPLAAYDGLLPRIAPMLRPETLVVDVCSVKLVPTQCIQELLPTHKRILMTHPLFGPRTAADTTRGHTLIVTDHIEDDEMTMRALHYCDQELGLRILHMTAEEHDRTMAQVHALTFFAARGLAGMPASTAQFMTPSYQKVLDLVAFDGAHSEELFRTIQLGNPFAQEVREQLIDSLVAINEDLKAATL